MRPARSAGRAAAGLALASALIGPTSGLALAGTATAAPQVSVHASLRPKIPGHATTIRIGIRVAPDGTLVPPPLVSAQVRYPAGIDVQLSGLGIQACALASLEALGPEGCPPDSVMGYGTAVAQIPIKGEAVRETARIAIVRAKEQDGHLALMLVAYDEPAISAQIVLPGVLLPADRPYGGLLSLQAPLVSTFPEGPDVSVTEIKLVLGPRGLRYRERLHGRVVHYEPGGIKLPERCGRGGYRFAVQLGFLDGSTASGTAAVACPRRSSGRQRPEPRPPRRRFGA
jgi:subtilisin family serine protease